MGAKAYGLCRRLYGALFGEAEQYLSAAAHQLSRPLPPASSAAHARFGGLPLRRPARLRFRPLVDDPPRLAR